MLVIFIVPDFIFRGGYNSECAEGYEGQMCTTCSKKEINGEIYGKTGPYKCSKCPSLI